MNQYTFKGVPFYLDKQTARLGVPQVVGHRARNSVEAGKIATLLSQLTYRHKDAWRPTLPDGTKGDPVFHPPEILAIRAVTERAEEHLQQLHILAAGSQAMLADAYAAFGLAPPKRLFEVLCDRDAPVADRPTIACDVAATDPDEIFDAEAP